MSHNISERQDLVEKRKVCWNNAFRAWGYAYAFQRRANNLRQLRRVITFLGIVVPVSVGVVATRFFAQTGIPNWLMVSTSMLSLLLLFFSIWGIIAKWEDTYLELIRLSQANEGLEQQWKLLAKETADNVSSNFDSVIEANTKQRQDEKKFMFSEKENRRTMRAALFEYQRECAGCNLVPKSLKPADCEVCGKF